MRRFEVARIGGRSEPGARRPLGIRRLSALAGGCVPADLRERLAVARAAKSALVAAVTLTIVGCSSAIVPGVSSLVAPAGIRSSETSLAFSPGAAGGTTVVQFNDFDGGSFFGWSWSTDGVVWNYCNATNSGCGGPGVPVPLAPNQANWRGDPGVVADPNANGVVVATQIANSIGDTGNPDLIVASLSFDGGRTFVATEQVNQQGCSNGDQDMQNVAVDATTSPSTFWFVWRHNGAGTYGLCVRGGTVNSATQAIEWLGPSEEVENLDRTPFWGVGGVVVQAGGGSLTVAYSNTDHIFFDCSSGKQVRWFTVTSANNGVDWGPSREVYDTRLFDWCAASDRLLNSLRAFGFVRAQNGSYWMAVHDSLGTLRVFVSTDTGASWTESQILRTGTDLHFPTVATDGAGRIGIAVNVADSSGTQLAQQFASTSRDVGGPETGRGWWTLEPVTSTFPVPMGTGSRVAGDYNGATGVLAASSPSGDETFAIAYTDLSTSVPRVAVVFVEVTR